MTVPGQTPAFAALPDPSQVRNLDELVRQLRLLKIWASDGDR